VYQPVMAAAEQYEVAYAGFSTIGPVLDVVPIDKMLVCAAWKAASLVPGL
jgi:hypothetical protein